MIFNKGGKTIQWERIVISANGAGKNWILTWKRMKLDIYYTIYKNKLRMDQRPKYKG